MEKKDSKFNWNKKNNGTIFGLCLVGVAAFSVLFATGQVKQAQKEKEQLAQEQAALENNAAANEDLSFAPQVDEAMENALDSTTVTLDAAQNLEEMTADLEASASGDIAQETEAPEEETELQEEEEMMAASISGGNVTAQTAEVLPTVTFGENDTMRWPVAGNVVLDYSMDGCIYFPTLQQYKYNPALVIGSDEGAQVVASARGIVESIGIDEETGTTVTMNLGDGYKLKYGQLQELTVAEGDVVEEGELIGYVSQPTKYYCKEGTNLYFAMTKDETPVDPILYLE